MILTVLCRVTAGVIRMMLKSLDPPLPGARPALASEPPSFPIRPTPIRRARARRLRRPPCDPGAGACDPFLCIAARMRGNASLEAARRLRRSVQGARQAHYYPPRLYLVRRLAIATFAALIATPGRRAAASAATATSPRHLRCARRCAAGAPQAVPRRCCWEISSRPRSLRLPVPFLNLGNKAGLRADHSLCRLQSMNLRGPGRSHSDRHASSGRGFDIAAGRNALRSAGHVTACSSGDKAHRRRRFHLSAVHPPSDASSSMARKCAAPVDSVDGTRPAPSQCSHTSVEPSSTLARTSGATSPRDQRRNAAHLDTRRSV